MVKYEAEKVGGQVTKGLGGYASEFGISPKSWRCTEGF